MEENIAIISNQGLFYTPKTIGELEAWVMGLCTEEERLVAATAMWMYNNLLCSYDKVEVDNKQVAR